MSGVVYGVGDFDELLSTMREAHLDFKKKRDANQKIFLINRGVRTLMYKDSQGRHAAKIQ